MTAAAPHPDSDVIEGTYRVIASRPLPPLSKSPNRRRMIARVALWNMAAIALAVMVIPRLFA